MDQKIKDRIKKETDYILTTKDTLRNVAKKFKVSKSTVHKDLSERLKEIDKKLFNNVNDILQDHLENRHIRGGEVTKEKYAKRKED